MSLRSDPQLYALLVYLRAVRFDEPDAISMNPASGLIATNRPVSSHLWVGTTRIIVQDSNERRVFFACTLHIPYLCIHAISSEMSRRRQPGMLGTNALKCVFPHPTGSRTAINSRRPLLFRGSAFRTCAFLSYVFAINRYWT